MLKFVDLVLSFIFILFGIYNSVVCNNDVTNITRKTKYIAF